jgi:hypothetical protein
MYKLLLGLWFISLMILLVGSSTAQVQQPATAKSDPIAKLLELPAPLPEAAFDYANPWERKDKAPPVPDDDAPIELLSKYWRHAFRRNFAQKTSAQPSDKVRQRFLEAAEDDPDELPYLLRFIPNTPEAHDRVKRLFDQRPPVDEKSEDWQAKSRDERIAFLLDNQFGERSKDWLAKSWSYSVRNWLMLNSRYFRDELVAEASKRIQSSDANSENALIESHHWLTALAKLDWEKAKPLLERLNNSDSPNHTAIALSVRYTRAVETNDQVQEKQLRPSLQRVVLDSHTATMARAPLVEALLKADWAGRDEWFLSFLGDARSHPVAGPGPRGSFYGVALRVDRERYIPFFMRLVGHPNRLLHDEAVGFLLKAAGFSQPRRELLLPLLPWLTDPQWTTTSTSELEQLIELVGRANMPECVPGLLSIIEKDYSNLGMRAAWSLENYHAPQAGPVLRKAATQAQGWARNSYVRAMVRCGVLTDQERLAYLEKYAAHIKRVNGDYGIDFSLVGGDFDSLEWNLGSSLSKEKDAPLHLAATLLDRVKVLEKENPKLAHNLWLVIQRWPTPVIWQRLVERLADGSADDLATRQMLLQREKLRTNVGTQLNSLLYRGGIAAGVAAVILSDKDSQQAILRGQDQAAQYALLACARLLREPLLIEPVSELYQRKDKQLSLAVDRYLETVDTAEARALILAQHPNEGLILGGRNSFDPSKNQWFKWEEKLRQEVISGASTAEILAMATGGYEYPGLNAVIRLSANKATITKQKDASREEVRELSNDEIEEARSLFALLESASLPAPIFVRSGDGHGSESQTEFVRVNRQSGRRVFTNTVYPTGKGKNVYQQIYNLFERLMAADGFKLRYYLADRIAGLEVLYAGENPRAQYVCSQGSELRVFVEEKLELKSEEQMNRYLQGLDNYDRVWRTLRDGKLTGKVDEPQACPIGADELSWRTKIHGPPDANGPAWQLKLGQDTIRAGYRRTEDYNDSQQGLWRFKPSREAEPIALGTYYRPLVTQDGKWIIVSKNFLPEGKERSVESIIRIDTKTYREHSTQLTESKSYLRPVVEVRELNKVLVCRQDGYDAQTQWQECWLLDPTSGKASEFKGEMRTLAQQTFRSLQSTLEGGKYWAAIPERKEKRTKFGLYDTRKFVFTVLLELPEIQFDSMQMWVDETARQIYVVYEGHLLCIPLPKR